MLDFGYYNMDCMQGMKEFPDNYFDLAIVDPPYGDGGGYWSGPERFGQRFDRYRAPAFTGNSTPSPTGGIPNSSGGGYRKNRHITNGLRKGQRQPDWWNLGGEVRKKIIAWDVAPGKEYFEELFRVSRNQIIWGGNYFELPANRCFLIWRKTNVPEKFSMAMCEYAWTSFNDNAKWFEISAVGQNGRFHPTQKPVELYKWILDNYAKPGDKILDTHVGSASSLIACEDFGYQYVGFEIDADYYRLGQERLERNRAQMTIADLITDWRLP